MMILNNILLLIQQDTTDISSTSAEHLMSELKNLSLDDAISKIANGMVEFTFKLLLAILVFYVGKFIINKLYKMVHNIMTRKRMEASLTSFVLSLVRIVLYFILIITVIGILGFETSSFLALFASAGVAIGMALSGTLQNFAGGVLILLIKPYKVGDYIEAQGYAGTVKEIQIFHTVINTPDNKAIIIPNGGLSTGSINNYSLEDYRRVDWIVSLSYDTDFEKAKSTLLEMLISDNRVVKNYIEDDRVSRNGVNKSATTASLPKASDAKTSRPPFVGIEKLSDSSIDIAVKAWTHADNYWDLYYTMNERFYKELPEKGLQFPYPQMDIHLHNT